MIYSHERHNRQNIQMAKLKRPDCILMDTDNGLFVNIEARIHNAGKARFLSLRVNDFVVARVVLL